MKKYCFTDKNFEMEKFDTSDTGKYSEKAQAIEDTKNNVCKLEELQSKLYSQGCEGILIVFQAMDAAGKDGAIKHVFSGINPQGVEVHNFKQPSEEELSHDYLWRASVKVPPRGKIAIFNRSYYEDVLIGKVRKLYEKQKLPARIDKTKIIDKRYTEIVNFENYLNDNGIKVVKFFLNISKEEQKKRFLKRIEDQSKNWKFSSSDILEREYWDEYMDAYEIAINKTSTPKNPWYIIPSDKKWYARALISEILVNILTEMDPQYPVVPKEIQEQLQLCKKHLENK